ncbi:MAG: hypothetical protein HYY18_18275 [Planctomycetes bacterium]|nr:hypothetical protein [Planctomycetota bacterium]
MRRMLLCSSFVLALGAVVPAQDPAAGKPTDADAKAMVEKWNEAVKAATQEAKEGAIQEMATCPHPTVIVLLSKIVAGEVDELRIRGAAALGQMTDNIDAAKALHAGLKPNEKKTSVMEAVFKAIESVNHPTSVAVCLKWASDRVSQRDGEDWAGLSGAIDALGGLKWKTSVDALIDLWHKSRVAGKDRGTPFKEKTRKRCDQALRRLTGENMPNQDGWDDWWKDNAKKFNADMTMK